MGVPEEHVPLIAETHRRGRTIYILAAIGLVFWIWTKAEIKLCPEYLEQLILMSPEPQNLRETTKALTQSPGLAGLNQSSALYIRDAFESFGIKSRIETYDVLLNYPIHRSLCYCINGMTKFEAKLREEVVPYDETSSQQDEVPTFHGYSANGNATGRFVYANYGTLEDFAALDTAKITVNGTIIVMRYGHIFRGLKVKHAEDRGAVGAVIYTDPADDAVRNTPAYPYGLSRHPTSVQRGSVQYLSLYPGDPTTPGYPSYPDAPRVNGTNMPSIPSLPISYEDALPILEALNGQGHKIKGFNGSLPNIEYWTGPSRRHDTLSLSNWGDYRIRTIWNVIGRIEGQLREEVVILGNHRDAWVFGAVDPISGTSCLVEVARGLGRAIRSGWRPLRPIILASWDAEEYGLVGSTEWVEDHASVLNETALAYLNVDMATETTIPILRADASPLLNALLYNVTKRIISVNGISLYDEWRNSTNGPPPRIRTLGSGSDYTPFQQHIGIPSLDLGYRRDVAAYHYHSNYDSFYWMDTFGDPDWITHKYISQIWALTAFTLCNTPIIAFNVSDYAIAMLSYLDNLHDAAYASTFSSFRTHIQRLIKAAAKFERKADFLRSHPFSHHHTIVNKQYKQFERAFISPQGLPGRPWYKHVVFAPGLDTGYAGVQFPALAEALQQRNHTLVASAADVIKSALERATELLR